MRPPISSVIANLFMKELEEEVMKIMEQKGFAPRSWDRYVDDAFSEIKKSNFEVFLEHLNEQHPNIRFTTEEEQNNELPFLDVRVTRLNGRLRTGVHREKTHTDRVLFFKSHHTISTKRSGTGSLLLHIDRPFGADDIVGQEKERQHLFALLEQNDYPRTFIERTLHRIECKKERLRWRRIKNNRQNLS